MSASAGAARPIAIILVIRRVDSRGGWVHDFDDDPALDTIVTAIGHIEIALAVDDDAVVIEELPWIGAVGHPALAGRHAGRELVHRSAVRGKLDHPPVVRIRDVHAAVAIHGNPTR